MKMAKASEKDLDAAGDLMSLLDQIDRGDYPGDQENAPDFFDPDNRNHLRAFYDAVMGTLEKAPGYACRVIGGMCYVIMYDKNEIIDPDSDVLELHPRLAKALESAKSSPTIAAEQQQDTRGALERIAEQMRAGGANLPAPACHGTVESALITGLSIGLCLVQSELDLIAATQPAPESP